MAKTTVQFTSDIPTGDYWQKKSTWTAHADGVLVGTWKRNDGSPFGNVGDGLNEQITLNEWKRRCKEYAAAK